LRNFGNEVKFIQNLWKSHVSKDGHKISSFVVRVTKNIPKQPLFLTTISRGQNIFIKNLT